MLPGIENKEQPQDEGGPWTTHGHAIPGITIFTNRPRQVARCGGPGICRMCSHEVAQYMIGDDR